REIDEHIRKEYLEGRPEEERDWRTSEQREAERIREAMSAGTGSPGGRGRCSPTPSGSWTLIRGCTWRGAPA
ncbi:MAG: hypothetical protein ACP5HT_07765, partial [Conexivisphaera sp.]